MNRFPHRRSNPPSQSPHGIVTIAAALALWAIASSLLAAEPSAQSAETGPRAKYNFNSAWLLNVGDAPGAEAANFADADWKKITLPRAWNEDSAFKVSIDELPTGIAWYRKHFQLPDHTAGKKVFLEFEGIRHAGEFYLNGEWIGRSENGVMAFGFDITDKVKTAPQENVLSARIDNAWDYKEKDTGSVFQWNDKNFYANYGGINKNVFLHITDKLHQTLPLFSNLGTTGVYVYATDFDIAGNSATIHAEAQIKNEYAEPKKFRYEVTVLDVDGKVVKTFDGGEQYTLGPGETKTIAASAKVDGLSFWSWGYGYLYDVRTTLKADNDQPIDAVTTRTGFRKTEFGHGMVKLNGRVIQMHGYAQRTTNEWPALGLSVPPWMSDFSNGLMVESNANLVRWMHVTPWKQDVESCDRVGLMEAMPAGDSERDPEGRRWEQRTLVMRDAIIYNRNNPSIVFYECGNKGISEDHMAQMKAIRDQYDPHGGRAIGAREMLDSKVAEYGGEMLYINKSARIPMWAMEYSRDEGLRKYWDAWSPPFHKDGDGPLYRNQDASVYNRNQDSFAVEDVTRWYDYWRERPGTGERVSGGGVNIIFSDSNTHHRGAESYRRSGEVDAMRIPKEGFWAHQIMWNGWVNPESPEDHGNYNGSICYDYGGQYPHPRQIHIIGHWNYAPGTKKPVYVVSTADKVELFLNGKSLGYGEQSNHFLFSWKEVEWQPGTLAAVGYGENGNDYTHTALETAGEPAAVRLTAYTAPDGLKADGADVALVDVELIDGKGNCCPTATNLIHFELSGPAEWRGGIAQGPDNYILSRTLPLECGINRISIRSLPQSGKIVIKAKAEGLKSTLRAASSIPFRALPGGGFMEVLGIGGRGPVRIVKQELEPAIELDSVPFATQRGVAVALPADGLKPPRMRPKPTDAAKFGPEGLIYFNNPTPTRRALHIASATAGVNADKAAASFDDNEETGWKNDDKRSTAWIQYELAQPDTISELTMKVGGWRAKVYPIRVLVDGQEVFAGSTPRGLGYVTIPLKPTAGKSVRIELTGTITEKDAFGGVTEVSGGKLTDAKDTGERGTLEIIETELYAPLK